MDLEGFLKTQKWICKVDDEGYKQLNAKMWQKILLVPYEWNMKCCFFVGDKYCEFKDKVTEFEFELSIVRKEKEGGLFIRFENGIYRINHLCMKAYNWYDGTKHKWEGVGLDVGCIEFEYVGLRFWYAAYKDIGADVDKLKCIKKVFAAMEEHLPSTYGEIVKDGRQHSKIGEESLLHAARLVLEIPEFKVFEKLYHELFQREKPAPFFCHVIEAVPPAIDLCFTHLIFKNMPLLEMESNSHWEDYIAHLERYTGIMNANSRPRTCLREKDLVQAMEDYNMATQSRALDHNKQMLQQSRERLDQLEEGIITYMLQQSHNEDGSTSRHKPDIFLHINFARKQLYHAQMKSLTP